MSIQNSILNFCVGGFVGGHHRANFLYRPKDAPGNFTSFDTNVVAEGDRGKMVSNEKLTRNRKLRRLKLRGLKRNQTNTPISIYENDQRNKIDIFGDSEIVTPTHIGPAHAFLKIQQNFENRIPREFDQKLDIPRISKIH